VDALSAQGVSPTRVLLIGGAAASQAVQQVAAELFGLPIHVPLPGEYVALGAARQAAWALGSTAEPPVWDFAGTLVRTAEPQRDVRSRFASARDAAHPSLGHGAPQSAR